MSAAWPALAARSAWLPGLAARWMSAPVSAAATSAPPVAWRQLLADPGLALQAQWAGGLPDAGATAEAPWTAAVEAASTLASDPGPGRPGATASAPWGQAAPAASAVGAARTPARPGGLASARHPFTGADAATGAPSALQWLSGPGAALHGATPRGPWSPDAAADAGGPASPARAALRGLATPAGPGVADARTAAAPARPGVPPGVQRTPVPAGAMAAAPLARAGNAGSGPGTWADTGTAPGDGQPAQPPRQPAPAPPDARPAQPMRLAQGAAGLGRLLSLVPRPVSVQAPTPDQAPGSRGLAGAPVGTPALPAASATAQVLAAPAAAPQGLSAADTDALLQALVDRLHVDYLRHYGSAG